MSDKKLLEELTNCLNVKIGTNIKLFNSGEPPKNKCTEVINRRVGDIVINKGAKDLHKIEEDAEETFKECFKEMFVQYKPPFARSIYRGLRFTDVKRTSNFSPKDDSKESDHSKFLGNYEKVQGEGRHTLNSLLSEFIDTKKSDWMLFRSSFSDNSSDFEMEKEGHLLNLHISQELSDILINNNDLRIIDAVQNLTNENKIKDSLRDRRKYAFYWAKCGLDNKNDIAILLKKFAKIFYGIEDGGFEKEEIFLEILQVLQGICIFLKYFKGSLICLLSREGDTGSEYSCVGEFFILGFDDIKESYDFCKEKFQTIDLAYRYYFRFVLKSIKDENNKYESLEHVLRRSHVTTIIKAINPLKSKIYNFDSLAGVIRLAERIRPSAVHEGKQQYFTFIVGFPYLLKDKLEKISNFTNKGDPESKLVLTSNSSIEWITPHKEKELVENEFLHFAKSRITGNSQFFQEKDVALFVDCLEKNPLCNCIVKPHPHGLSYYKSNIIEIMSEVDDAVIIRILGQKKIEIFHKGLKILVWSHVNVMWDQESTWDINSLSRFVCDKLKINEDRKKIVTTLAKVVYQISQTQGLGASFVIYQEEPENMDELCPRMTIPFPDLGEGRITDNEKVLKDAAIQDGGTIINLATDTFSARRQWSLPTPKGIPFWHKNFPIPEKSWNDDIINKKWNDSLENEARCINVMDDDSKLLYTMCRYQYLKKEEKDSVKYLINPFPWDGWYKILSWGTRHMSSLGMSASLWDKAVVVVVSADSTITVLYQGIEGTPNNVK